MITLKTVTGKTVAAGAVVLASSFLFACSPSSTAKCPAFTVAADVGKPEAGSATFTLSPTRDGLTYNWSTSAGTISSGQGTPSIVVSDPTAGDKVTATVEVSGVDASCPASGNTASATANMP